MDANEFDAHRINLTHEADVLQLIERRTTNDLRALIKGLKCRGDAALDKVKDHIEGDRMQKSFLDSR